MNDREALGARLKRARRARGLTLKGVEAAAGISATHVSEIERGKTSPTTGALARIADALGLSVAYFLEERELGSTSRVAARDLLRETSGDGSGWLERLTTAIAGGRLQAARIGLSPGASRRAEPHAHRGEEAALVMSGRLRFRTGDDVHDLGAGDSIQYRADIPHTFTNTGTEEAVLLWVSSERGAD